MTDSQELLVIRFKRYLHYGSEEPIYETGDRFHLDAYTKERVPSLIKLIAKIKDDKKVKPKEMIAKIKDDNEVKPQEIINIIVKVKKEGTSLWPDCLVFALVECAGQNQSEVLATLAYKELRTVCMTAREMILFVKLFKDTWKSPGGSGWKKAIARWYLVWMPFDLADIFLSQKRYYGWTHADILQLAHVKPVSIEQKVLLRYAAYGLAEAEERFGEEQNEQVQELLEYISSVEKFRKCNDPEIAAKAVAHEWHPIERVSPDLLENQEVWDELIYLMDLKTLLDNLQRISSLGFLKNSNTTVMRVLDLFNNRHKAQTFKGHPIRVFIELLTYENTAKYCLEIASKLNHPISKVKPEKKPPKHNSLLKHSMMKLFYNLLEFQKPTGLRYLVAVDVRPKMLTDRCHKSLHVSPIEAAQAICLSLVKVEPKGNVTVCAYQDTNGDLVQLSFSKKDSIAQYASAFSMMSATPGPASVESAILWAGTAERSVDVFLILSNYMVRTKGTHSAINKYRNDMKLPQTKLVTCCLSGNIRTYKDVEGENMLCVIGFDDHLCGLVKAFAIGAF